jgi:hypothetical protein
MNRFSFSTALLALSLVLSGATLAHGGGDQDDEQPIEQIMQVRRATASFHDVQAARAAGYEQFQNCTDQPGQGAMGIHYLNGALAADAAIDPLKPEALMYEPRRNGRLELVGVEYIVFQDAWDALHPQPPQLFGHPFHLVRSPNRYGVPAFYELHLWVWKHNRNGIFNDWNPRVRCTGSAH